MKDDTNECAVTDASLLDYFEGELDAAASARLEEHAARCLPCGALLRDVNGIRTSAASLSDLAPSHDLWKGIESRIQPRVVSIGAARLGFRMSYRWLAAAAALLVVSTSGVTYLATSRTVAEQTAGFPVATPAQVAASSTGDPPAQIGASSAGTLASSDRETAIGIAELPYDGEIRRLQSALVERSTQLDSATVRVVEENLRLIDTAVRQARAALARDPASGFLSGQLNNALEKKIELLRTAAMLSSTT